MGWHKINKLIKVKHGPFKALGVWYSYSQEEILKLNLDERIKKLNTILNIWRSRNLSLKGNIIIIKTLAIPQIQYDLYSRQDN